MKTISTLICIILFFSGPTVALSTSQTVTRFHNKNKDTSVTINWDKKPTTTGRPRSTPSEIFRAYYFFESMRITVDIKANIGLIYIELIDSNGDVVEVQSMNTTETTNVSFALPQQPGEYLLKITTEHYIGTGILVIDELEF